MPPQMTAETVVWGLRTSVPSTDFGAGALGAPGGFGTPTWGNQRLPAIPVPVCLG